VRYLLKTCLVEEMLCWESLGSMYPISRPISAALAAQLPLTTFDDASSPQRMANIGFHLCMLHCPGYAAISNLERFPDFLCSAHVDVHMSSLRTSDHDLDIGGFGARFQTSGLFRCEAWGTCFPAFGPGTGLRRSTICSEGSPKRVRCRGHAAPDGVVRGGDMVF
jgi:hypothetical protein